MAAEAGPLTLRAVDAERLVQWARASVPGEACGLLVGRGRLVERLVPTANASDRPTEYEVPPEAHFAAIRAARSDGLAVIGAFHSHPASVAVPSPRDAATAFPNFLFLIVGLRPSPHLRAWTFDEGNFTEVPVVRR